MNKLVQIEARIKAIESRLTEHEGVLRKLYRQKRNLEKGRF